MVEAFLIRMIVQLDTMNLLILGGQEWSRVWSYVHKDRELLKTGTLVSIKTLQDARNGFSNITAQVCIRVITVVYYFLGLGFV